MKDYCVSFYIYPKKEVLDIEGRTVGRTLNNENFPVKDCRMGKYITMKLQASHKQEVLEKSEEMAQKLLSNPFTEDYRIEIES